MRVEICIAELSISTMDQRGANIFLKDKEKIDGGPFEILRP